MDRNNRLTMVGTLSDTDIAYLCSKGKLIAKNYKEDNVKQACYELRASNIYYDLSDKSKKYTLSEKEYILIKPKQLIVIITLEALDLPPNILGRILTKGKLFSIGLLPVNTYADPGFRGELGIVFYNLSNNFLRIYPGESIAKIEFSKLLKPVRQPYQGQHGYQTKIWPVPYDYIIPYQEALQDRRVKSPTEEITLAYGKDIGNVMNRVFKFERYLILAALSYIFLSLVLLSILSGTSWMNTTVAIVLGIVSNLVTSLLMFFATNLRSR